MNGKTTGIFATATLALQAAPAYAQEAEPERQTVQAVEGERAETPTREAPQREVDPETQNFLLNQDSPEFRRWSLENSDRISPRFTVVGGNIRDNEEGMRIDLGVSRKQPDCPQSAGVSLLYRF